MEASRLFDTVFDITRSGTPDLFLVVFGVVLGSIVAFLLFLVRARGWAVAIAFPILWFAGFAAFSWVPYYRLRADADRCEVVQGTVLNYAPEPYDGHADPERFQIGARTFTFSNGVVAPGFKRTIGYGGVHLAGRVVRMCVLGNDILKLEVQRDAWPEALSTVSFRLSEIDEASFSMKLYHVTQASKVGDHRVVWAKDFAISDFELAAAGACDNVVPQLERIVVAAADTTERANVTSAYRNSARCVRSPAPPLRSWKPAPRVLLYGSDGKVTTAALTADD